MSGVLVFREEPDSDNNKAAADRSAWGEGHTLESWRVQGGGRGGPEIALVLR
jgi:hypothetical protein